MNKGRAKLLASRGFFRTFVTNISTMKKPLTYSLKAIFFLLFAICAAPSMAQVNLDSGLVAFFKASGNYADSSALAIHGTGTNLTNAVGLLGLSNEALSYNGTSSKINCGTHSRGISHTVTASVWIKTTASVGQLFICEKYNWTVDKGFYISIVDGIPVLGVRNTSGYGAHTQLATNNFFVADGEWHHIMGVVNQNTIEMWVDGDLKVTSYLGASNPTLVNNMNFSIGYYEYGSPTGNHRYFDGLIDEVRLYNRVLTSGEIAHLSNQINNMSSTTDMACDSYTDPYGNTYTTSGTYQFLDYNSDQADSLITMNITIAHSSSSTEYVTACDSFTWTNGVTYYASTDTETTVLTNAEGCDSIITLDLTIINVDNTVSVSGNTLTANQSGATYQWYDCETRKPMAGGTSQSFTPSGSGNYQVVVTNGMCSDTSDCMTIEIVGIQDLASKTSSILVFPNPAKDEVFVAINSTELLDYTIYDMKGQMIQSGTLESNGRINITHISTGIYFVRVKNYIGKFVVE